MTVFWFRRDLRIEDNTTLFHALNENESCYLSLFLIKNILEYLQKMTHAFLLYKRVE